MAVVFDPKFIKFEKAISGKNYLYYSEQLNNATYWAGEASVTANTDTDLEGQTTMDTITWTSAWGTFGPNYTISGLTANTQYRFSFDVKQGSQGTFFYVEVYDEIGAAAIDPPGAVEYTNADYSSVTRVNYDFTTPVGCTEVSIYFMSSTIGDNIKVGRVQFALPTDAYAETTTSPIT